MQAAPLRRQPQYLPQLAPQYAADITSAMVGGYLFDIKRGVPVPMSDGLASTPVDGQMTRVASPQGMAWKNFNVSAAAIWWYRMAASASTILPTGTQVTILWQAYKQAETAGGQGALGNNISGTTEECNIYLPFSTDGNVYWRWGGETNGSSSLSVAALAYNPWDWWAFTAGPRGMEIWQNFKRVGSNAGAPNRAVGTGSPLYWGVGVGLLSATMVLSSMFVVLKRQLPTAFLGGGNYWGVFSPPARPQIMVTPTAAAAGFFGRPYYEMIAKSAHV